MPFGFTKHLEELNKSNETIKEYTKTINLFFRYIDMTYGREKEVYEINPADIKGFLSSRKELGNGNRTLNKHLGILKGFFDYLWKIGKAPLDPAMKIEHFQPPTQRANIVTYEMLLKTLEQVIKDPNLSTLRKAVFVLAMKGLRSADFQIKKDNVIDQGDSVTLKLKKRDITLRGIEATVFLNHFIDSHFNSSDYVFVTNKQDGSIVPAEHMSIHIHLNAITELYDYPVNITLNNIRHAYAYYLYTHRKLVIEEITDIMGIEIESAASLVKVSQIRHEKGKKLLSN